MVRDPTAMHASGPIIVEAAAERAAHCRLPLPMPVVYFSLKPSLVETRTTSLFHIPLLS